MSLPDNNRLIHALQREPVDKTPIWIMRQAGRYLPEYRELRKNAKDFLTLCKTPELACEVTLQPIRRFDLDAAIIFSDILIVPDALGLGLFFESGKGPCFEKPIKSPDDIKHLPPLNLENLQYLDEAIQLVLKQLNNRLPLIGFTGSPWTLATYMLEGGSSKNFNTIKRWLYTDPESLKYLLTLLAQAVTNCLLLQINAGVHAVMIFDTWGGILSTHDYLDFSLSYMHAVIKNIKARHKDIPIILFTKNGGLWLETMADSGCDALGLDWTIDISWAQKRVGNRVALQGNMDPAVLYANPSRIREEAQTILSDFGNHPGHIFNLGHGILPDTPPEHISALINAVRE